MRTQKRNLISFTVIVKLVRISFEHFYDVREQKENICDYYECQIGIKF